MLVALRKRKPSESRALTSGLVGVGASGGTVCTKLLGARNVPLGGYEVLSQGGNIWRGKWSG
jgi:hypothetical protein